MHHRPRSLPEVVAQAEQHGDVDGALREFLDEFYSADPAARGEMIAHEPPLLLDERRNAFFAAAAEHLAMRYSLPIPQWVHAPLRFLSLPYFPAGLESLKAMHLAESPAAFRRRLIFVDADPLFRPRRLVPSFVP